MRIVAAAVLSLAALWVVESLPGGADPRLSGTMLRAARTMNLALAAVRRHREQSGFVIDTELDPNRTGLIGPEYSPLMTTLGDLDAKRSTTNPNFAALIVGLLDRAGVRPGDSVAIGSSGSFPALLAASLAAANAMEVKPVVILSLGASTYGATDPGFTLLDLYDLLVREGVCSAAPAAVSLGGAKDTGSDFEPWIRQSLRAKIRASGIRFLDEPDLQRNVAERVRLYQKAAGGRIAAFINIGGGVANFGTSPLALELHPGLNLDPRLPAPSQRGVLFEMAAQGIPVIHLLYIKGLVIEGGLPWDPVPLPQPEAPHGTNSLTGKGFLLVAAVYFSLLFPLVARHR